FDRTLARLGYMDDAVVDAVFPMVRPKACGPKLSAGDSCSSLSPRGQRPSQHLLGAAQVRAVEHLAVEADDAGGAGGREGVDDALGLGRFLCGRGEDLVDHWNLGRVDRQLRREAVAKSLGRLAAQTLQVTEAGEDGIDRRRAGRDRSEQAERSGETVGFGEE